MTTAVRQRMTYSWTIIFVIIAVTIVHAHYARGEKTKCKRNRYEPCVQNLCCCYRQNAYCEGHGERLGYIPKLPRHIQSFEFKGNFLPQLSRETLANISHLELTVLAIINDGVLSTTEDTFADQPLLKKLVISSNSEINKTELSLSFNSLTNIKLRQLYLENIGLTTMIPERFFKGLNASNIERLSLGNNRLTYVNMSVFRYLPNLRYLRLNNNAIKEFTVDISHPTLQRLQLTRNKIGRNPPSFCSTKVSLFPKLKQLFLDNNLICDIVLEAWKCLSNLTELRIGGNMIQYIPNNTIADLTSLREFWVDGMSRAQGIHLKVDKLGFNNTSLQRLRFNSNNIVFTKQLLQNNIFAACKQISDLSISKNNLWELSDDDITGMLSPLTQLKKLYMDNTRLRSIPKTLLKHFPKLQELELDGNDIQELGESLSGPHHLTRLSIQSNNLKSLKPESFPLSVIKTMQSLNLAGNSFDCSCENLWFRNWIGDDGKIKATNISLKRWPKSYVCYTPKAWNGKLLKTFRPTEASCRLLLNLSTSLGSIGGILFIVIISIPICIRYRWHIQYMWYKLTKTRKNEERRPSLDNEGNRLPIQPYTYVIYHDNDRDFVHQALRTFVEEESGFKLYIWHRNAAHGSKANVMFDAIHSSSHVLAIISSTFVTDGWCEFQLEIGLVKKNETRKDCLTLLLLENLDRSLLRRSWCVTLEKNATVHWCSGPESIQWRVCRDQLKSRLPSVH